ncbi:hypothetical protein D1871_20310 [Nakamurella silvestris]|nr:hypothetical protein D1871_20310 [Nakamurella silvestris]
MGLSAVLAVVISGTNALPAQASPQRASSGAPTVVAVVDDPPQDPVGPVVGAEPATEPVLVEELSGGGTTTYQLPDGSFSSQITAITPEEQAVENENAPAQRGAGDGVSALSVGLGSTTMWCTLREAAPTTTSCDPSTLTVGRDTGGQSRRLALYFPIPDFLEDGAKVTEAYTSFTSTGSTGGSGALLKALPLSETWNTNVTWNRKGATTNWTTPGGTLVPTLKYRDVYASSTYTETGGVGSWKGYTTALVQAWINEDLDNNGVVITETGTGAANVISVNGSSAAYADRPSLTIDWVYPARGAESGSTVFSQNISDRAAVSYNPASRAAWLTSTDLSIAGVGPTMTFGHVIRLLDDTTLTDTIMTSEALAKGLVKRGGGTWNLNMTDGSTWVWTGNGDYKGAGTNASLKDGTGTDKVVEFNSGVKHTYELVDGLYRLATIKDKSGNASTFAYTSATSQAVSKVTNASGRWVEFTYTSGYLTSMTDNSGRTVSYTWAGPDLASVTDADSKTTTYARSAPDPTTWPTTITSPSGYITQVWTEPSTFSGNGLGVGTLTFGQGTAEQSMWTATFPTTSTTVLKDPLLHKTTYTFDKQARITEVKDHLNHTRSNTWTANNDPQERTDALGAISEYTYDTQNAIKSITSPAIGGSGVNTPKTTFTYEASNGTSRDYRPKTVTDPQNKTSTNAYNLNGMPTTTTSPTSGTGTATVENRYQGDTGVPSCGGKTGQLCQAVDGNGNATKFTYNSVGDLIKTTPPAPAGESTMTYDSLGRLASKTDGKGSTLYYTYDPMDRITKISTTATTCPGASCMTYTYNAEGWLTGRVDPSGTTTYTYDAQGRPLTKNTPTGNSTATYDTAGNLLTHTDPGGTVGYVYDTVNRLVRLVESDGSCPALPTVPTSANSTLCTMFTYDNNDRRTKTTFPNGQTIDYVYNSSGQYTRITAKNGTTVLTDRTYNYLIPGGTKEGVLVQKMVEDPSLSSASTLDYTYDGMSRLVQAKRTTGSTVNTINIGWDDAGNRTSITVPTGTQYARYNKANQLCFTRTTTVTTNVDCGTTPTGATGYAYDGAGNQTTFGGGTNAYNAHNQNSTANNGTTAVNFTYADVRNNERTKSGTTTFANTILGMTSQTTGTANARFIREPNGNLFQMRTPACRCYYTTDNLGSVILMTNVLGNVLGKYTYTAFGATNASSGTEANNNPYRYATGYTDTHTGLTKIGARYYDPTQGRFTQPDPSGQEANPYLYAGGNPTTYNDPSGLGIPFWEAAAAGIIGGIVGAAVGVFTEDPFLGFAAGAAAFESTVAVVEGGEFGDVIAPWY